MQRKIISPVTINALKEALTSIYWYKSDLRSFLLNTISDPGTLSKINWEDYKRNIVTAVIDYYSENQEIYQNDLLKLINEIVKMDDFTHLLRLDDGKEKERCAKNSIEALKKIVGYNQGLLNEEKKKEQRRKKAHEEILKNKGVIEKLESIKNDYYQLMIDDDAQKRGFKLEIILKELFTLFDLDPKASFRITGEQIDGAFTFENTDYLFEAKWQKNPVGTKDLDGFSGKLNRKLDNTLGLFLSVNGFSVDAVKVHSSGRRLMILMDGSDLMAVIEGRIDLLELLLRKRRYASQTGIIYLKIHEILIGN
jgi:hypothetical protein